MFASRNQLRYRYATNEPKLKRRHRRSLVETLERRAMLAADIDFGSVDLLSYGGNQDAGGTATIEDSGSTVRLEGNTWKAIELSYDVTPATVLEFDFQSSEQGEIHGIGFDDDLQLSRRRLFELYGTQRWGLQSFNNYATAAPETIQYRIPVGEFFTGEFEYLVFANDHDAGDANGESVYSNVRLFEDVELPEPVDDDFTVTTGRTTILDVLANDQEEIDEDSLLTVIEVGPASEGGSVSIEANRLRYQSSDGFLGTETFTYTVENSSGLSASAQVTVTVSAPDASGVVFELPGDLQFTGQRDEHITIRHSDDLALSEGTYSLSFTADDVSGRNALFSKDASGYGDGGHLTALVENGKLKVRFQSDSKSETVQTLSDSIVPSQEYHLAVTFGPDGFWLYLDGAIQDWETDFFQTMEFNTEDLLIGANGWSSTPDNPDSARDHFEGTLSDFTVFDSQMTRAEVRELAGLDPPVDPTEPFVEDGVLYGTLAGETLDLNQYPGVTSVVGDYGDDLIVGSDVGVVLAGGHGEDRLVGGDGNDILYSFADGREPRIYQDYDPVEDDPYGEIDPETRTHFAGQPIEADDVLRGGGGADIFHFRTLIAAKRDIILKHVGDDRRIHWHGVAGENDNVHDHWAERIGNEVIEDFSREEGDHIEIVGHTIDVERVRHVDLNDDGVVESTVLYIQSNQGNAGAHNRDKLGTITALNALLTRSDYTVNAAPAYGIVETID
ncbi:MAG: LamG-like jellyroll fold domain-containing protein, partial [Planctomycetota bacterium]